MNAHKVTPPITSTYAIEDLTEEQLSLIIAGLYHIEVDRTHHTDRDRDHAATMRGALVMARKE